MYLVSVSIYLCDLILPFSNARNLRSDNMLLIAPCHPRAKLKSNGERSFQYAASTEWNKLTLLIRESPSMDIFKTQSKTFLFKSILNLSYYYITVVLSLFFIVHTHFLIEISLYYIKLTS